MKQLCQPRLIRISVISSNLDRLRSDPSLQSQKTRISEARFKNQRSGNVVNGLFRARAFCFILLILLASAAKPVAAQSTAFTYQGKLSDSGNPANGNYDLQIKLFDTATVGTGTQQGTTQTL